MPPTRARDNLIGIITILLALIGWTAVPLFIEHFTYLIDPWTSNGWRYGFAAMVWAPVLLWGAARRTLPKGLWRKALLPSAVNCVGQVCFVVAHYRIEPGLLTFGLRTQMIFVAIGAFLLFPSERRAIRTPVYLAGLLALLVGTSVSVLAGNEPLRNAHAEGIGLAVLSGLAFACYALSVRKYMHNVNSIVAFAAISQLTSGVMVILMLSFGDDAGITALKMPRIEFFWLMLSSLIGIALGHVFYYISIARLGVAVAAGVVQLQPFAVGVASIYLFGEVLTGWQWTGGGVAVVGAGLMLAVQQVLSRRAIRQVA